MWSFSTDPVGIKMFVLDEADEMLSRGFKDQIHEIFTKLPADIQVTVVYLYLSLSCTYCNWRSGFVIIPWMNEDLHSNGILLPPRSFCCQPPCRWTFWRSLRSSCATPSRFWWRTRSWVWRESDSFTSMSRKRCEDLFGYQMSIAGKY